MFTSPTVREIASDCPFYESKGGYVEEKADYTMVGYLLDNVVIRLDLLRAASALVEMDWNPLSVFGLDLRGPVWRATARRRAATGPWDATHYKGRGSELGRQTVGQCVAPGPHSHGLADLGASPYRIGGLRVSNVGSDLDEALARL